MHAVSATVIAFPGRAPNRADVPVLDLPAAPRSSAMVLPVRSPPPEGLAPSDWAPNLLLAAPLFMSPKAGSARDVVAVALAMLAFSLASRTAAMLPRLLQGPPVRPEDRAEPAICGAAALLAAATLGSATMLALLLLVLLEVIGRRIANAGLSRPAVALTGAALLLRIDAGAAVVGSTLHPLLLAAAACFALFGAALASSGPGGGVRSRARRGLWGDLALLGLAAATVGLYAAGLLADPWVQRSAGVWPLLSVPPLLLAMVRLWFSGRDGRGGAAGVDPWLAGAGAAWALTLTAALPLATL